MRADAKEARSLQSGLSSRNREKWAGCREFRKKRRCEFSGVQTVWRRERDSNPRYGFPYSGFQDRLFQPLTHPSAGGGVDRVSLSHLSVPTEGGGGRELLRQRRGSIKHASAGFTFLGATRSWMLGRKVSHYTVLEELG